MDTERNEQYVTLVREHWRQVDERYREYFANAVQPDCVGCHKAYCCRQLVLCTEEEAQMIRAHVRGWSSRKQQALSRRLAKLPNQAQENFAEACPFLVEERCQIYSVRPLACRAFHSMNKSRCKRRIKSPDAALFTELSNRNRELRGGLEQAGGRAGVVAMPIWMKYHWRD